MAGFDADISNYSDDFGFFEDYSSVQDLASLPNWANSISTSSHSAIAPQGSLSGPYNQAYSPLHDFLLGSVPQVFPDAGNQHFTAHGAEPFQSLQQLQASMIDSRMTLDMSDGIQGDLQEIPQPTKPTPSDENVPLRCGVLGCPEQQIFPTKAALKRHQDKHIRPYYCQYPSCNRKNFRDKGGLDRHRREVHGSQAYKCPVRSCKRYKKGFHRRYNLVEHQRRAHGCSQPSDPLLRACDADALDDVSESDDGRTPTPQSERRVEAPLDGEEVESGELSQDLNLNSGQDLQTKLRMLLIMRAELDEDIRTMKRALSIMGGESP